MSATTPDPVPDNGPLEPVQFSLRGLFWTLSLCCLVCGAVVLGGPVWGAAIAFIAMLVVAHVAGNWLGTTLRDGSTRWAFSRPDRPKPDHPEMPREPIAPTRLQARQALSRLPLLISGATAAFSSIGGGALVVWQYGWTMGGLGITFASAAAGVLGAIAGYFASCFVGVAHATWRDAVRESKRQREDPPLETEN